MKKKQTLAQRVARLEKEIETLRVSLLASAAMPMYAYYAARVAARTKRKRGKE